MSGHVYAILAIAAFLALSAVLLRRKERLQAMPIPPATVPTRKMLALKQEEIRELAREVVRKHPALGMSPESLLDDIRAFRKSSTAWAGSSTRIILEKLVTSANIKQAMGYWQVREYLAYRSNQQVGTLQSVS